MSWKFSNSLSLFLVTSLTSSNILCSQYDSEVIAMHWKHVSQYFCKSFSEDSEKAELYEMGKLGMMLDNYRLFHGW